MPVLCLLALSLLTPTARAGDAAGDDDAEVSFAKGVVIESADGDNKLKIGARVQSRLQAEADDSGSPAAIAFSIPRARIKLSGHVWSKDLGYTFQADFGKGSAGLKDFYLNYKLSPGAQLRVGQFKRPFMRQQLTSSGSQELVDRAITDKAFGGGRDIGVMLHSGVTKRSGFEWAAGIFNGTGDKPHYEGTVQVDPTTGEGELTGWSASNVPDAFGPMLVLRAGYTTEDTKAYSELDLEGGELRAGVGVNALADFDTDNNDDGTIAAGIDYMLKVSGLAATGGFLLNTAQSGADFGSQDMDQLGFYQQLSYVTGDFAPAARYARVIAAGSDAASQELTAGLSWLPFGHKAKWQLDGSLLTDSAAGSSTNEYRARTQVQLAF